MASEDSSELTNLDSDEYVDTSKGKGKKGKSNAKGNAKDGTWRVKGALKPSRATTYTTQALYDQIHSCDIDLVPEYQRDVVWPESKQIHLIDSIFRNFYIPPVIFAVNIHDDGSETRTCIDGKQRLTSIHRFMDGLIPHKDPSTGEKLWYKDAPSGGTVRKRVLLPQKYRKQFANKQIVCVEYHEISLDDEREVFQRVQLGMALTPAEKLQAITSPRADFVRGILSTHMRDGGPLGPDSLNWETSRAGDFRCLAESIYNMEKNTTALKSLSFTQLEKWLALSSAVPEDLKARVEETYRIYAELVVDKKFSEAFMRYKKVSPVEFTFIGVFIYLHKDKATMAQLAAGIADMRDNVRESHTDVRMNTKVQKTLITFMAKWKPGKKAAGDSIAGASAGVKRKRGRPKKVKDDEPVDGSDEDVDMDEDGDDDDAYKAPKAKKKTAPTTSTRPTTKAAAEATSSTPLIKTEPVYTTIPLARPPPKPPADRLASLRESKRKVEQDHATRAAQLPNGPRPRQANSNPQMLPSPAQNYALPFSSSSFSFAASSSSLPHPPPPPPPPTGSSASSVETTLMASMMRQNQLNGAGAGGEQRSRQNSYGALPALPPPPHSAGGSVSSIGDRDRDRRSYDDRGYDDRDRDRRYENTSTIRRRDNGYAGRDRSPDYRDRDRDRGRRGGR